MRINLRMFFAALAVCCSGLFGDNDASAQAAPAANVEVPAGIYLYDAKANVLPDQIWLERGAPRQFQARAFAKDGRVLDVPIRWIADPAGVVSIAPNDKGTIVTMTAVKDLFDTPNGLEPWTNVRACVGHVCKWVFVTGTISLSGTWNVDIDVTNTFLGIGSQEREMIFAQEGRILAAYQVGKDAGKKPMVAVIRGRVIDFQDPNNQLTKFSGVVTVRSRADGTWRSRKEYEGVWTATRLR